MILKIKIYGFIKYLGYQAFKIVVGTLLKTAHYDSNTYFSWKI